MLSFIRVPEEFLELKNSFGASDAFFLLVSVADLVITLEDGGLRSGVISVSASLSSNLRPRLDFPRLQQFTENGM